MLGIPSAPPPSSTHQPSALPWLKVLPPQALPGLYPIGGDIEIREEQMNKNRRSEVATRTGTNRINLNFFASSSKICKSFLSHVVEMDYSRIIQYIS